MHHVTALLLNGLRDYGLPPSEWPAVSYAPLAGLAPVEVEAWRGCLGLEPTVEMYVGHLVEVFRRVHRVLRDDGTLWLNLGDSYARSPTKGVKFEGGNGAVKDRQAIEENRGPNVPAGLKEKDLLLIPHRVALALQADGWTLRQDNVWAKGISFCASYAGSVMPESVRDRTTRSHEYVFMLSKQPRYYYDNIAVKERSNESQVAHNRRYAREYEAHTNNATNGQPGNVNNVGIHARALGSSRNLRSVWAINPKPDPRAHFAAFPDTLVAPMIKAGTSKKGVCSACGAPWERVVEREAMVIDRSTRRDQMTGPRARTQASGTMVKPASAKTTGWEPSCSCDADMVSATVLDPFAGTGTVGEVARRLGRSAVLIERSATYTAMIREGIAQYELF